MNSEQLAEVALDIVKSPTAVKMLDMVTYGFYDRSRVALWMFEAIGREYDDMEKWTLELRYEIFPQTCTWSIPIWEFVYGFEPDSSKSLEWRRNRIMAHRLSHSPINPARIEAALSALTETPVDITEFVAPYTFRVDIIESEIWDGEKSIFDHAEALRLLRRKKPSHLSFSVKSVIESSYTAGFYHAGAIGEKITENLFEPDRPHITTNVNYSFGTSMERIVETYIQSGKHTSVEIAKASTEYSQHQEYFTEAR